MKHKKLVVYVERYLLIVNALEKMGIAVDLVKGGDAVRGHIHFVCVDRDAVQIAFMKGRCHAKLLNVAGGAPKDRSTWFEMRCSAAQEAVLVRFYEEFVYFWRAEHASWREHYYD